MALKAIRDRFISLSGRRDLVDDNGNDAGADFYINAGQRFLDRELVKMGIRARGRHSLRLPQGAYYFHVPDALVIEKVWATSNSRARHELYKTDYTKLVIWQTEATRYAYNPFLYGVANTGYYYSVPEVEGLMPPMRSITDGQGCPVYWALSPHRLSPMQNALDQQKLWGERFGLDGVLIGHGWNWRTIVISPAIDGDYTFETIGYFGSGTLEDDVDQSYWSEEHPETLTRAALYQLEADYRNSEGTKDWLGPINQVLQSLDTLAAIEESANVDQMKG